MDALMIIILLTFVPIKDTDKVGISYEAKSGLTTMDRCKQVEKVLTDSPPEGKTAIVLCFKSNSPTSSPVPPKKHQET